MSAHVEEGFRTELDAEERTKYKGERRQKEDLKGG